jgi:hypothetical protein
MFGSILTVPNFRKDLVAILYYDFVLHSGDETLNNYIQ